MAVGPKTRREIEIDAPPERLWTAVATEDGYARWSCARAEAYEVVLEPRVGGRYQEHGTSRGTAWTGIGRVIAYDPPTRMAFTFRVQRADGTLLPELAVTILLVDLGGRTRVVLEHTDLNQLSHISDGALLRSFEERWIGGLEDLYAIVAQEVLPALGHLLIYQAVEIQAPAERVWHYLATEEGRRARLRLSYPQEHRAREVFEARAGGRWESAGISAHSGDPYRQFGRVVIYEPPRHLAFTLQEEGWPAETLVTYRLTELSAKTRVTLVHSGFERLPAERRERARKAYEIGRFKGLERLRDLVEGRDVEVQYPISIRKEIELDAAIDTVWRYVGTEEGSRRRHAVESIPGSIEYHDEVLEATVGGRYELRGAFHGRSFQIHGRVVAYDPPRLLAMTWREADWPVDTLVTFRLTEAAGGKTTLVVIHAGFEHLPPESRGRTAREYDVGRQRGLEALGRLLAEIGQ
jgi:uncharacterized protein YndB with AHSA1/START domain